MEEDDEQKARKAHMLSLRALIQTDPLTAVSGVIEMVPDLAKFVNDELHKLHDSLSTGKATEAEVSQKLAKLLDRIDSIRAFG
jgi:hypothetical protein